MKFYWTEDKITALADVAGLEGKPHKLTTREAAAYLKKNFYCHG